MDNETYKQTMRNRWFSTALLMASNFIEANAEKLPPMALGIAGITGQTEWTDANEFVGRFRSLSALFGAATYVDGTNLGSYVAFTREFGNPDEGNTVLVSVRLTQNQYADIADVSDSVKLGALQYIREGRKIAAIKYIRERTGMGLRDAKTVADQLADDMNDGVRFIDVPQNNEPPF